jgi:hypothetical protein
MIRGEYWHSGHLDYVETLDLDGDRVEELVLAGTNRGVNQAVLVILDPRNVKGAAVMPPDHPDQLGGFPPGTEQAIVFFGRTRLSRASHPFNYAYLIEHRPSDGTIQVSVRESLAPEYGYIIYGLSPRLELKSVVATDSMKMGSLRINSHDPRFRMFDDQDVEQLKRDYKVVWRTAKSTPGPIPASAAATGRP